MFRSLAAILLAAFIGCRPSVELATTPTTVPADSGSGYLYGPEVPVVYNPYCDSLRVAQELLRRALSDVQGNADTYRISIQAVLEGTRIELSEKTRQVGELRKQVEYFRAKLGATVNEPAKPVPEAVQKELDRRAKRIAELEQTQERHTWRDWFSAGAVGAGILVAFVVLAGGILWLASKRILPDLKF